MTLLAVRPMGLAFIFGRAHPRPAPTPVVYDEPELPPSVLNWTHTGRWPDGTPPGAYTGGPKRCNQCDVSWTGSDPCWSCSPQPVPSVFA